MDVEISAHAGFCFGVRRALRIARETAGKAGDQGIPAYTFGSLVHNPQVTARLEKEGIFSLSSLDQASGGYLVIRSHGVPPQIEQEARDRGFSVIDATCPLVKKIHRIVRKLSAEAYRVIIIGRRTHPEVAGIMGYAGQESIVVESSEELARMKKLRKAGAVVQTTAPYGQFLSIASHLLQQSSECRIFNTICFETQRRQKEAEELARKVDAMIVVGGRDSSNTRRLSEICQNTGTRTYLVESCSEIEPQWLRGAGRVGITAGASTPEELLAEVKSAIDSMAGKG